MDPDSALRIGARLSPSRKTGPIKPILHLSHSHLLPGGMEPSFQLYPDPLSQTHFIADFIEKIEVG